MQVMERNFGLENQNILKGVQTIVPRLELGFGLGLGLGLGAILLGGNCPRTILKKEISLAKAL